MRKWMEQQEEVSAEPGCDATQGEASVSTWRAGVS